MKTIVFGIVVVAILIVFVESQKPQSAKKSSGNFTLNERVALGTRVGNRLTDYGYLEPDPRSHLLAARGLCQSKEEFNQPYAYGDADLIIKIHTQAQQSIDVETKIDSQARKTNLSIEPLNHYYSVPINLANLNADSTASLSINTTNHGVSLSSIKIRPFLGDEILVFDAQSEQEKDNLTGLSKLRAEQLAFGFVGKGISPPGMTMSFALSSKQLKQIKQIHKLPGLRKSGHCEYVLAGNRLPANAPEHDAKLLLPSIMLSVPEEFLDGELGLQTHNTSRGRGSEIPAKIINTQSQISQSVGLRLHGGVKSRKSNAINNYRIYARRTYGNSSLDNLSSIFVERPIPKTLVLRSNQAYAPLNKNFRNPERGFHPYNHAIALEIGSKIGAYVPRSRLVDFSFNGQDQQLYLALDHLSKRYFESLFPAEDLLLYKHKNNNDKDTLARFNAAKETIISASGEEALEALTNVFSLDNVVNSIILTAYTGDDDYCQGVELMSVDVEKNVMVRSYNWDLDHAFISFDSTSGKSYTDPQRYGFSLLAKNERSFCPRNDLYSHVFFNSARFRQILSERLDYLFANDLSPTSLLAMLEKYEQIDQLFYNSKHQKQLTELQAYFHKRPAVIREQLEKLMAAAER